MTVHELVPEGMTAQDVAKGHPMGHPMSVEVQRRHGVRYLQVWFDERARKAFCLMEAPGVECALAVHRDATGLRADRIYQVRATNRQGVDMTAPFVFIGTYHVREGKLEAFKKYWQEFLDYIEPREPRLISINLYVNDEGNEVSVVQVHPDADSMLFHMGVAQKHIGTAYAEYLDSTAGTQIYGTPNDATLAMVEQSSGDDVSVSIKPNPAGGINRFAPEPRATAIAH